MLLEICYERNILMFQASIFSEKQIKLGVPKETEITFLYERLKTQASFPSLYFTVSIPVRNAEVCSSEEKKLEIFFCF